MVRVSVLLPLRRLRLQSRRCTSEDSGTRKVSHQRPVGGLWSSFATAVLQWANGPGGEDEEAW